MSRMTLDVSGGATPLAHWGVIRAEGDDAAAFLNGQLTSEMQSLSRDDARLAGYCSAKGRLLASFVVWRPAEHVFLLACSADVLAATLKRLSMYVLRAKVKLAEAADLVEIGIAGPEAALAAAAIDLPAPAAPLDCAWVDGVGIVRRLGDTPRYTVIAPASRAPDLWSRLRDEAAAVGTPAWKLLDIEAGVPAVYPETQDRFVPQMCNLDVLGGISFDKGCYTGQEIIARVHYRGAVKRHMEMRRLDGPPPAPGTRLDAGEVVDAAPLADGGGSVGLVVTGP